MSPAKFSEACRETWLRDCYQQAVYARRNDKVMLLVVASDTKEKYLRGLERAGQEIARQMPGSTIFGLTALMSDDSGQTYLLVSILHLREKRAESEIWRCVGRDLVLAAKGPELAPLFDDLLKGYTMAMFVTDIKVQP